MCLIALALHCHPKWPVVIIANRDEYFDRPTRSTHWHNNLVFGGIDLQAGGAWMAVNTQGHFAAVTNVRKASAQSNEGKTRGAVVPAALSGLSDSEVNDLLALTSPCNLITGALWPLVKLSYQTNAPLEAFQTLSLEKVHTLSNGRLNDSWPKANQLAQSLQSILSTCDDVESIEQHSFVALTKTENYGDALLPATGVPLEWERVLSSAFITVEKTNNTDFINRNYGTRSSTVICVNTLGQLSVCERTWSTQSCEPIERQRYTEKRTQFTIPAAQ